MPTTQRHANPTTTILMAGVRSRKLLITRFVAGVVILSVGFLIAPRVTGFEWWIGLPCFLLGNLVRPLYRPPVKPKDRSFTTAIETINFILVLVWIVAMVLVLKEFSWSQVSQALSSTVVMTAGLVFFTLVALRDLMHLWRQAA